MPKRRSRVSSNEIETETSDSSRNKGRKEPHMRLSRITLFLSAALFGLLHPLTSTDGLPWPWGLWTGIGGLLFAYLREKSGSVIASTVAHGLFVLPAAFFG